MDGNSFIIDSLTYSSLWGGGSGRSLERINVDLPSSDNTNWGTSVSLNNATPGKINSISPKDFDLQLSEISITPVPLVENSNLTAQILITNLGNNQANSFTVELYN
ncbi:MAG: hypothetical protein U5K00_01595, partial [Melioribacteraceae bacterium]|nr:hypothetical protein [Melioribacteraceae bacterium]